MRFFKRLPLQAAKYPLLGVAISMCVGVILTVEIWSPTVWYLLGGAIAIGLLCEVIFRTAQPLIFSLFGVGAAILTYCCVPTAADVAADCRYDAVVVADSDVVRYGRWERVTGNVLAVADSATGWRDRRFTAFVNIDTSTRISVASGDTIALTGYFRSIEGDYGRRLDRQGISGQFYAYRSSVIGVGRWSVGRAMDEIRHRAADKIAQIDTTHKDATATMVAMTIGLREQLSKGVTTDYRRTGVAHLLAISGLHIGIIVVMLNMLFAGLRLTGRRGRIAYSIVIIAALWGYAFFCLMSPSVLRAVVMFTLYQLAKMIHRDGTSLNVLAAAFIVLLVVDPISVYNVGFQLSFVAMVGISTLYAPLRRLFKVRGGLLSALCSALCVALAAQAAVLPLVVYYFGYLPYIGLFVGLLLWAFVPVIIGSTLLFLATSVTMFGQIGVWTAWAQNSILGVISGHQWIVSPQIVMPFWLLVLIYGVMIAGVYLVNTLNDNRLRRDVLSSTYNI